jgi:hypothetical protein
MTPIVNVPSYWVMAYLFGIGVSLYYANKSVRSIAFWGVMAYLLGLTIGLRLYYS